MRFKAILKFVGSLVCQQRILMGLTDVKMAKRIKFPFSYSLQVGALSILRTIVGYSPWYKLVLPYGIKCLYNASGGISGSIDDILFKREYFLLDLYKPRERDVVVDVGAYVGLYSILSSKIVGNDGFVIAIEPEPHTFRLLVENLKLNNLDNLLPLNFALSDQEGEIEFYVPKITSGSSFNLAHLKTQKIKDYATTRVKAKTIDFMVKNSILRYVDIMKVDVEGAELSVLRGARNSLEERLIDRLIVEVHKTVNTPEILIEFLKSYGYIIDAYFDINEYKGMLFSRAPGKAYAC